MNTEQRRAITDAGGVVNSARHALKQFNLTTPHVNAQQVLGVWLNVGDKALIEIEAIIRTRLEMRVKEAEAAFDRLIVEG